MEREFISDIVPKTGQQVTVMGWVNARRDMGKLIFIDLRDRTGLLQVVFLPSNKELLEAAGVLRPEFCIAVTGTVNERPEKLRNPKMVTGSVEMVAEILQILNEAKTPPFEIDKDTMAINEELRLKYRYLDLRSERMLKNLVLRDRVISYCRQFLHDRRFLEVETPYLTKGTPEGAREFIVPSRIHPGKFYVLPQSPQQFKQLLMVAGVERYFQVARCFRDEDQRGDRQPEFTQLDLEMSFVDREDVMGLVEEMMIDLVKTVTPEKRIQQVPFPRLTYKEAMEKYNSDKPDLREDKNDPNLLAFCWVIDFPFFEKSDEGGWTFTHNPFSAPQPQHRQWLMDKTNIGEILTTQYDIVLNGYEAGGGSIRNHTPESLHKVFEIMGFDEEQIQAQFGHMLEAFSYGAPPHGGIAPGLDRLVMILANEPNIREVIPIPKTGDARDPMMGAPSPLPPSKIAEAHISIET
ncbi:MAG: aspartate--tRNA ligase [Patescibacteria group bacterium]|nr:aspartate--tRNA ligase [Patescibacteria group bacterium]